MDVDDSGGVMLVTVKRIFIDFDIDCEYAIALSYRMARGDHMIIQMWEPHQTSAFLNAVFIKIYLFLTGTTTGIALYLNIIGSFAKFGVAFLFYRTFRLYYNRKILFFMCAFFLTVNAKNFILLEFSNMMVYFSILLFCALFVHFRKQEQGHLEAAFLGAAAICFCLEVLSYPSAVILFPLILLFFYRYSMNKRQDMIIFSAICVALGGVFSAFLILQSVGSRFWLCVRNILTGDSTHQTGNFIEQLKSYAMDIRNMSTVFAVCIVLAFLLAKILTWKGIISGKDWYFKLFFYLLFAGNFFQAMIRIQDDSNIAQFGAFYSAVYIPIIILGCCLRKYCNDEERMAFYIGTGISIGGGVAVLLLTNLNLLTTGAYLVLGVMMSMLPIGKYLNQVSRGEERARAYMGIILFLVVVVFRNVYVFRSLNMQDATLPYVRSIIKEGPMKGIISDYMGGYMRNVNLREWKQYIRKGDKILIVSFPVSAIGYLYEDTEISADSTISTPTYSEKLLTYWEMNPWKEPNVVILDCWFGEPHVSEDEWIMQWIEENFDSYVDGTYIRVYRRE